MISLTATLRFLLPPDESLALEYYTWLKAELMVKYFIRQLFTVSRLRLCFLRDVRVVPTCLRWAVDSPDIILGMASNQQTATCGAVGSHRTRFFRYRGEIDLRATGSFGRKNPHAMSSRFSFPRTPRTWTADERPLASIIRSRDTCSRGKSNSLNRTRYHHQNSKKPIRTTHKSCRVIRYDGVSFH